jgi:FMN phosphatase YigB (HAD superfamily)
MIPAVIFDLDNCLSAADGIPDIYEPGFRAIREANAGTLPEVALERAFADCWRYPLDEVARRHRFSKAMTVVGWREFGKVALSRPMSGYPDLPTLGEIGALRFLVTSGFQRLQESKIEALGIRDLFTRVYVDAIDRPGRKGKERIFREILAEFRLRPDEAVVVGDTPHAEIEAGNRLGIPTVQILRPGVERGHNARYYIRDLQELRVLVEGLETRPAGEA